MYCSAHGGTPGFTPLVLIKRPDGTIELNPHGTDTCVVILNGKAANAVFDILGEWLG